ncbi:MAG: cytidine deaminase [Mycoplasma sp.]|nr:cytidine deaminase [Mycoplasma sp.]
MTSDKFIDKLKEISKKAYVPYSNFHVVAYFENENDKDFWGVNIENASYPNTMCAERVALHSAINNGIDVSSIKKIHVYSIDSKDFLSPCGGCRQTISEHVKNNPEIVMYNNKGENVTKNFSEIFPFAIDSKNIKGEN